MAEHNKYPVHPPASKADENSGLNRWHSGTLKASSALSQQLWSVRMVPNYPPLARGQNEDDDIDVYLVLDNFGELGRVYRETDLNYADRRSLIDDLLTGRYHCPERVIIFNIAEAYLDDASLDIAREVAYRVRHEGHSLHEGTLKFLQAHLDEDEIPLSAYGRASRWMT